MSLIARSCPAHGTTKTELIMGDNRHIDSPAMVVCVACMEAGATPGGCWAEVVATEDVFACKKCGAMVWDVKAHDDFHDVPAGRRRGYESRYMLVAMVPNLLQPNDGRRYPSASEAGRED